MQSTRLASLTLLLAVAACAPSPLYVPKRFGTGGEIPRDGRGEPIWSRIKPPPPPRPPAPAIVVNPGPPIQGTPGG